MFNIVLFFVCMCISMFFVIKANTNKTNKEIIESIKSIVENGHWSSR